jgi:hypothetical protein
LHSNVEPDSLAVKVKDTLGPLVPDGPVVIVVCGGKASALACQSGVLSELPWLEMFVGAVPSAFIT